MLTQKYPIGGLLQQARRFLVRRLFVLLFGLANSVLNAQTYFANGDAKAIGGDCYQLTAAQMWQNGSVWYADQIDLREDFDLEFYLYFGTLDESGADGIIFVLQTVGNRALGASGGGIGFQGFAPSLGIEFDTWQNIEYGDPVNDHISIISNGSVDHRRSTSLAPPENALPNGANIEDGADHLVRITWDAAEKKMEVWFDCSLRQSLSIDLENTIFRDTSLVYWGFTSATGGAMNIQRACLKKDILVPKSYPVCKGDTVELNVRESLDGVYRWFPADALSATNVKRPLCFTQESKRYYAEFTDLCGNKLVDTIDVKVSQPFVMDEADDTLLCDGERLFIRLQGRYDSVLWENRYRVFNRAIADSGTYSIRAWKGVCFDDESFHVRTGRTPSVSITGDSVFCADEEAALRVNITPPESVWTWENGTQDTLRMVNETRVVSVSATNRCGTDFKQFKTRQILFDALKILGDSIVCDEDPVTLRASLSGTVNYLWSTGATTPDIKVSDSGLIRLRVNEQHCITSDSLSIRTGRTPVLDIAPDILLCIGEDLILDPGLKNTRVYWNGVERENYNLFGTSGILQVRAENFCGSDESTSDITLVECTCDLIFPNAITTNRDGLNELFRPFVDCDKLRNYQLSLYNRWGEQLMETSDVRSDDIARQLQDLPLGVYAWVCQYSGIIGGNEVKKVLSGEVHVLK